nr:MAG TPA: hypothetical protein [Caudoviricetes sp.]
MLKNYKSRRSNSCFLTILLTFQTSKIIHSFLILKK